MPTCACGRSMPEGAALCDECRPLPRERRFRHSKPLSPLDWMICLFFPPVGVALGLWSMLRRHPRTGAKRIGVSAIGLCIYVAVYQLLGIAAAWPSMDPNTLPPEP